MFFACFPTSYKNAEVWVNVFQVENAARSLIIEHSSEIKMLKKEEVNNWFLHQINNLLLKSRISNNTISDTWLKSFLQTSNEDVCGVYELCVRKDEISFDDPMLALNQPIFLSCFNQSEAFRLKVAACSVKEQFPIKPRRHLRFL